jgi:hypothetical protein
MKKFLLLSIIFLFSSSAYSQITEFYLHFNSGLFSFGGESASKNTIINEKARANSVYINNPFGSRNALSYGLSAQIQRVTTTKFIFGLQSGFEVLRDKVNIIGVSERNNEGKITPASGNTFSNSGYINIYPNLGRRFILQNVNHDLTAGPEIGFPIYSREKGKATFLNGKIKKISYKRDKPPVDYRVRLSLTAHYKKWGISTGYSFGLRNYAGGYVGGSNFANARFIHFGISYELF